MRGFGPGDVVALKSGGPDLTVEDMLNDEVVVSWRDDAGDEQWHIFLRPMLVLRRKRRLN